MKKILYIIFIFLFFFSAVVAQNSYTDSLRNELSKRNTTTEQKFQLYNSLVDWFRVTENFDDAHVLIDEQLKLAFQEKNHTEQIKALVQRGIISKTDYERIQTIIDSISLILEKTKDPVSKAYSDYLQAYRLNHLGEYKSAVEITLSALEDKEKYEDDYIKTKLNYLLYTVYSEWIDLANSRLYAQNAVDYASKSGNKDLLSNAYAALAVTFTYQYDETGEKDDLDSVLSMIEKAADLYYQFPDQVSDYTYAIARVNKASYLLRYFPELTPDVRKEIEESVGEVLSVNKNLKNGQPVVASAFGILSELARKDEDLKMTEQYLLRAQSVLLTQKPVYYHTTINVVRHLSELYAQKGDYAKAFEFQQKVSEYSRLLFDQNQAETSKRLEAIYRFEKKEQEMLALKEKSEHHRRMKFLYAGLGIVGLAGSFFMFRSYHFKLRYSLTREKQLDAEKHEAEIQVKLEKEEHARLKAEQELLTLQQQKLQDEVLAGQLHVQHKNEVLQNLKEKLGKDSNVNIQQVIREESLLDNDFEKAKFRIQELHPDFFKNLNEKTKQKLTSLDLKYCAYLYLGMDTKQIAGLLHVEPKSVRMTKYRLKKKFALGEEMELEVFLKGNN